MTKTATKITPTTPTLSSQQFTLDPTLLQRTTDPHNLSNSTENITTPADYNFGQNRAVQAIRTALDIHANGYHIFAAGENGLGKRTLITRLLNDFAKNQPTPDDWAYVYNYKDGRSSQALSLPAGMAQPFADEMHQLWTTAKKQLNKRFRSDH